MQEISITPLSVASGLGEGRSERQALGYIEVEKNDARVQMMNFTWPLITAMKTSGGRQPYEQVILPIW
jgi:hypothetical protein